MSAVSIHAAFVHTLPVTVVVSAKRAAASLSFTACSTCSSGSDNAAYTATIAVASVSTVSISQLLPSICQLLLDAPLTVCMHD
jgi:hypothetical protein